MSIEQFITKIVKLYKDLKSAFTKPMNTVVLQEAEKYNRLLSIIVNDLTHLEQCMAGDQIVTEEIERLIYVLKSN